MTNSTFQPCTALILHFRDHVRTSRCLDSLEKDGVRRVLLVDNSGDGGESLGHLLGENANGHWPHLAIEVVDPGTNLGFSAGVNRGLEHIRELYGECCVLLINSDAELRPGTFAALQEGLHGGLHLASATMVSPDGSRLECAYYQPYAAILSVNRLPGSFRYLSACCMLLGPILATPPLFDERFFFYGEDIQLGWRLSNAGVAHDVVESAEVVHEGSSASGNGSLFYEYHMARAHLLLPSGLARSRTERWGMLLGRLLFLPLRATVRSARSFGITPWKGLILAARHMARGITASIQPGRR